MEVEVTKFYILELDEEKEQLTGNLTIRLPELGLSILGVFVSRRKDSWTFIFPGRKAVHHETGKEIRFPFVAFEGREKQKALIDTIKEKGRAFIEARLADKETPLIFLKKPQKKPERIDNQKAKENAAEPKQKAPIEKPKSLPEWQDPPKRDIISRKPFAKR